MDLSVPKYVLVSALGGIALFVVGCGQGGSRSVSSLAAGADKITICHVPPGNPENEHTITIGEPAVDKHLANHVGDHIGECPKPNDLCDGATAQVDYCDVDPENRVLLVDFVVTTSGWQPSSLVVSYGETLTKCSGASGGEGKWQFIGCPLPGSKVGQSLSVSIEGEGGASCQETGEVVIPNECPPPQ